MNPADFNYSHTRNDNPNGSPWLLRHATFWFIAAAFLLSKICP